MDWTRGGAQRVFEDEWQGIMRQNLFGFQTVARHIRLRKGDVEIITEFAGKITLPLDFHCLTCRAENRHAQLEEFGLPRGKGPVDGHGHDEIHSPFLYEWTGRGKQLPAVNRA